MTPEAEMWAQSMAAAGEDPAGAPVFTVSPASDGDFDGHFGRLPFPKIVVVSAETANVRDAKVGSGYAGISVVATNEDADTVMLLVRMHAPMSLVTKVCIAHCSASEWPKIRVVPFRSQANANDTLVQASITIALKMLSLVCRLQESTVTAVVPTRIGWSKSTTRGRHRPLLAWTTIEVKAPAPRAEPAGGTHASPRLHQRRGHYRNYKSGKRVWVADMMVGSAKNGIGFHDYEVRGAAHAR